MKKPRVSIIIPTRNSSLFLENSLKSIKVQTYKNIEVLVVDGGSKDKTISLAKKYKTKIYIFDPHLPTGVFDAPYKRNYGVKKAKGKYVYYMDADMELPPDLISEAVSLCEKKYDALILPEDSFGIGIWARAKNLERRCYWGDNYIESPRFFKKKVWEAQGGLDESLSGGRDDGDLYEKLKEKRYKVGRTKNTVMHNEGHLTLKNIFKKKVMYGQDVLKYVSKRPAVGVISYFPIRLSFFKNWRIFMGRPVDSSAFVVMKTVEVVGGSYGVFKSIVKN
jgi:glycosyltransferase involved in cell wall biosynthesis